MPVGQVSTVLPDPVLTGLAVELGTGGPYAANMIAPVAKVMANDFKYAEFGREEIKDDAKQEVAPGMPASEVTFGVTYKAASIVERKLKSRIADTVRNNNPSGSIERRRTRVLTNKLMLGVEKRLAALLRGAPKTRAAPATKWDAAGAKIRDNMLAAKTVFRKNTGMEPNVAVIPPIVFDVIAADPTLVDMRKYREDLLASEVISEILRMKLVIPGAIEDTSNPGAASNVADVWSFDEVYYLYVDPSAGDDLEALTALRQVRSMASGAEGLYTKKYRDPDESAEADLVSVHLNQLELLVADSLVLRQLDVLT